MSQEFCIWIVSPPNCPGSRCFEEAALALHSAFRALGYDAPIVTDHQHIRGRAVVFGANLLPYVNHAIPSDIILYNLEQVQQDSGWFQSGYVELLRNYVVWDYSGRNIEMLKQYGVNASLCGIGYAPELTRIPKVDHEDIDVLFIGMPNDRRMYIVNEIAASGRRMHLETCIFGPERDALIARAKIVLNMHFYAANIFEIVRVSYMLANHKCVVSETGDDHELERPFYDGVAFASYNRLVSTCLCLLDDYDERTRLRARGFECFSNLPQVSMLRRALISLEGNSSSASLHPVR